MRRSNKNHPEHAQYMRQRAAWQAAYETDPTEAPWSKSAYNLWSGYSVYHIVVGDGPPDLSNELCTLAVLAAPLIGAAAVLLGWV